MGITTKKYYTCCLCGRTSTDKDKIKECEASHIGVYPETSIEETYGRNRKEPYPERHPRRYAGWGDCRIQFRKIEPN